MESEFPPRNIHLVYAPCFSDATYFVTFSGQRKKLLFVDGWDGWEHQGTILMPSGSALCWPFVSHLVALEDTL